MGAVIQINGVTQRTATVAFGSVVTVNNASPGGGGTQKYEVLHYPLDEDEAAPDFAVNWPGWTAAGDGTYFKSQSFGGFGSVTFTGDIPGTFRVHLVAVDGSTVTQTAIIRVKDPQSGESIPARDETDEDGVFHGWHKVLQGRMKRLERRKGDIRLVNVSGGEIARGKVVRLGAPVDGYAVAGNTNPGGTAASKKSMVFPITLADNTAAGAADADYAILEETLPNNTFGWGKKWGLFLGKADVNMSAFTAGTRVYLSSTGTIVNAKPGTGSVIMLGVCKNAHATDGAVAVTLAGGQNSLLNGIAGGQAIVGGTAGADALTMMASSAAGALQFILGAGGVADLKNPTADGVAVAVGQFYTVGSTNPIKGSIAAYSSTYTSVGPAVASSLVVAGIREGGLSLAAAYATGDLRLYSGGSADANLRLTIPAAGGLQGPTGGLTITGNTVTSGFGLGINLKPSTSSTVSTRFDENQRTWNVVETDATQGNGFGAFNGAVGTFLYVWGATHTPSAAYDSASSSSLLGNSSGGLSFVASHASGGVNIYTGGTAAANLRSTITAGGNQLWGTTDDTLNALHHLAKTSAATSGTQRGVRETYTFNPASGTGVFTAHEIVYTINQTGGANGAITGIYLDATETALVGTHTLMDLRVGGVQKFVVVRTGGVGIGTAPDAGRMLHVQGGSASQLLLENTGGGASLCELRFKNQVNPTQVAQIYYGTPGWTPANAFVIDSGAAAGPIRFEVNATLIASVTSTGVVVGVAQGLSQETVTASAIPGLLVRTTTLNTRSVLAIAPNGTSPNADIFLFGGANGVAANYSRLSIGNDDGNFFYIFSDKNGSGVQQALRLGATGAYPPVQLILATDGTTTFGAGNVVLGTKGQWTASDGRMKIGGTGAPGAGALEIAVTGDARIISNSTDNSSAGLIVQRSGTTVMNIDGSNVNLSLFDVTDEIRFRDSATTTTRLQLFLAAAGVDSSTMRVTASKTIPDSASALWKGFDVATSTLTLGGTTQVTSAAGLNLVSVAAPTITYGSAVTVDRASTMYIAGPPVAGGSVTITSPTALLVDDGVVAFDYRLGIGTRTPTVTLELAGAGDKIIKVGSTDSNALLRTYRGSDANYGGFEFHDVVAGHMWGLQLRTGTSDLHFYDEQAVISTLRLSRGDVASATSAALNRVLVSAATVTVTGTTQITTATGFNYASFKRPTYTNTSAGLTVDIGATVYIENAPLAAGNLTLTSPLALWVDAGNVRIDGIILGADTGAAYGFNGDPDTYIQRNGADRIDIVAGGNTIVSAIAANKLSFFGGAGSTKGAAVADATDAATAISQLNLLLARCRAYDFIAT